jgi:hypothetical protein
MLAGEGRSHAMEAAGSKQELARRPFGGSEIYAMGYVRDTGTSRGRGVYATRDIEPGEVVEVCPVLFVPGSFGELSTELKRAVFAWAPLAGGDDQYVVSLGYGGIYNHANPANLNYFADAQQRCLMFAAAVAIPAGVEMTINFNRLDGGVNSYDDSWFRAVGLEPFA